MSFISRLPAAVLLSVLSLLSAFLLFQVQPVISKFILPWFGGSPGVWTTCMVFFQVVLFAGYAYAHALTRLRPRTQLIFHALLMLGALLCLPISPADSWKPAGDEDPVGRILLLLLGTVGLPYFVLSSTSPLAQVWFTRAVPGGKPWRLYALSNLGSLVALLSYPLLIEPRLDVTVQTALWSGAFIGFAVLSLLLAWRNEGALTSQEIISAENDERPRWWQRVLWVLLPALASVLLLATTNHVCQDVAVVPFMWVAPLSLYLITFIICFEHERWYVRGVWALLALGVVFIIAAEKKMPMDVTPNYLVEVAWCFGAMFLGCMVCHGELARLKPAPARLTEFYLMMSAGGALGGLLVSQVAPRVFVTFMEWPLGLIMSLVVIMLALVVALWRLTGRWLYVCSALQVISLGVLGRWLYLQKPDAGSIGAWLRSHMPAALAAEFEILSPELLVAFGVLSAAFLIVMWMQRRRWLQVLACTLMLVTGAAAVCFLTRWTTRVEPRLERVRNFFGTVYVDEDWDGGLESHYRTLTHGGIVHGMQNLAVDYREEPVTYYGRMSGIGVALAELKDRPDARVGIVGMGAGTVGCYAQRGQTWRFYEINPEIPRLARKHFTYLADAEKRGATVQTIIGDARLMLEREPAQQFDVMLLDAFSGDAIPVHLLTREAFAIYRRHMKPDGIIVVHVTNSYLSLTPVVEAQAAALGWRTTRIITDSDGDYDSTDYVLVTQNEAFLKAHPADEPADAEPKDVPLWTDRYHNLFQILMLD